MKRKHEKALDSGLLIFFSLSLLALFTYTLAFYNRPEPSAPVVEEIPIDLITNRENLLRDVNEWRVSQGKAPYIESEFLCSIAEDRLPIILTNFSHDGFEADKYCNPIGCTLGENLARGYERSQETVDAWVNSEGHRDTLERPYTHTCIASKDTYSVQIFGYY